MKFISFTNLQAFATGLATKIESLFVRKEAGKGLSTNDYTTEEKTKLSGIADGANKTVVDAGMSATSTNPVQNKVVYTELDNKVPTSRKVNGKALSADVTLTAADVDAIPTSSKGSPNGIAELDSTGKVPAAQLPSFVDDVIEGYLSGEKFYKESAHTTEITAESGKIYVDLTSNKTYRWSGTTYAVISDTIALGETSTTAYRGDRGKTAYDHSQSVHAPSNAERNTIVGIKKNGSALTLDSSRAVNIEVPTKFSDLEDDLGITEDSVIEATEEDIDNIINGLFS